MNDESLERPPEDSRRRLMLDLGALPVHVDKKGRVFIGDDEFMHPIIEGSISFSRTPREHHGFNIMTVSLIVGDVTMTGRKAKIREQ